MSNKTIIYLGGFDLPDNNAAAQRVVANSIIMSKLGYKIVFIGINKLSTKILFFDNQKIDSLTYTLWSLPYPKNSLDWISFLISSNNSLNIIKKYMNVSFIFLYNYPVLPSIKILNYSKKNNIKVISDVTEWYQNKNIFSLINLASNIDSFLRMRIFNKKVDGLIVISKYLYDYYNNMNRILIPPLEYSSKNHSIDVFHSKSSIKEFTYFGSPGIKDNIDLIVNIFTNLKIKADYKLNIIGIDKISFIKKYSYDESKINVNFIHFHGRLSHLDTLNIVKKSDFTIFFRKENLVNQAGFPTKFVESFAYGIPVITNSTSNISDYLINGYNGFIIDSWNPLLFGEVIIRALKMSNYEILNMKKNTVFSNKFHFSNYFSNFSNFFISLNETQ